MKRLFAFFLVLLLAMPAVTMAACHIAAPNTFTSDASACHSSPPSGHQPKQDAPAMPPTLDCIGCAIPHHSARPLAVILPSEAIPYRAALISFLPQPESGLEPPPPRNLDKNRI